jgi:ATP-dependent 26S proteasome regulatory subunit
MTILEQIQLCLRARHSLIYLISNDELAIDRLVEQLRPNYQILVWDMARGWYDQPSTSKGSLPHSLSTALERIKYSEPQNVIYLLRDVHPYLQYPHHPENALVIRQLRNLASLLQSDRRCLIITSPRLYLPEELSEVAEVIEIPLPSFAEISELIRSKVVPDCIQVSGHGWEQLVKAFQGMSYSRIQRVLALAIARHGCLDHTDIDMILHHKMQVIKQTGILEFIPQRESLKNVGGLEQLKQWVRLRRDSFSEAARQYGIPTPKGVLLVGIQGTGKSLSAKTIASEWGLPLLRLDTGRLFAGIVGESENRTRQMISLAEAVAPCVLWIDEIDKAFGNISRGVDGDSGTSRRVFASLITWMQEKTSPVFIVATANDVQILPAELLRKGRFDEIFFLNLPTEWERQEIFRVHLHRLRPHRLREFDIPLLAKQTNNFSGAEIAQVIVDGMHRAFARANGGERADFGTEDIIAAIEETVPLAAIAKEQIDALKKWVAQVGARTASYDRELIAELKMFTERNKT